MDANTTASDSEQTTTPVDVRTTDLAEFENGETIRVHYRDAATDPSETVTGRIECHYTDRKVMIVTDAGRRLIVDLEDTAAEGGLRDFETSDVLGRPMFAESAYHVEETGEDVETDGGESKDDDTETPDTLVYDNRLSGRDETGAEYEKITTIEVRGEVVDDAEGVKMFDGRECDQTAGGTGIFYLREDGVVLYELEGRDPYEAGENGRIE